MKREKDIQNEIRIALAKDCVIFRTNVGSFYTDYGGFVSMGLPEGFPDLFGFRKSDGKAIFIEVKNEKGKRSKKQIEMGNFLETLPVLYGVARSTDDALNIIR